MDAAHIHLLTNHFPIVGLIIFTPLFLYALWKKKTELLKVCCLMIFLLSLMSIVVFNTGEAAEEVVEDLPGISHEIVHEHEEAGEKAFWILNITGMLAIVILALRIPNSGNGSWAYYSLAILLLLSVGVSVWTGYLGGKIRHPEYYSINAPSFQQPLDSSPYGI